MHLIVDILRNSILITGLVVVMMMMIESLNIESKGLFFSGLKKTKIGQVVFGALLGSVPGCMGGFATVSLYTHKMFSFGALVAMMIASSGDEAFVMLAMISDKALLIFALLFVIAIAVGIITDIVCDRIHKRKCKKTDHSECGPKTDCHEGYAVHELPVGSCNDKKTEARHDERSLTDGTSSQTGCPSSHIGSKSSHASCTPFTSKSEISRHYGWKRISMFLGLTIFIIALATGHLGHDHSAHGGHDHSATIEHHHGHDCQHSHENHHSPECQHGTESQQIHAEHADCNTEQNKGFHSINLLDEQWMNVLFAALSIIVLLVLLFGSDHFIEEHLWNHIVKKHLLTIFLWTFGVLLVVGIALQYIDIDRWISDNTVLMIILATLIGIIPESGPHMIFVTLYAAGVVPLPVLLASSISQDGHASLPLIAESRKSFLWAKIINCITALAAGFTTMLIW